jgi:outer membrane protein TolC
MAATEELTMTHQMLRRGRPPARWRRGAGLLVLFLSGCATLSADRGFGTVEGVAKQRLGKDIVWTRSADEEDRAGTRVSELLSRPLSMDDAVQVALLNNKGLQASFEQLGISEAELVQAGRLPNPGFSFGRLRRGEEVELERGLHINLARLVALPWIKELEARRFQQTQGEVSLAVLTLAADTRKAWVQAVAAEEAVRYMRQVQQAAEASAELARRMAQVGNFNKLQQLREQGFYADAAQNLARAERASLVARERLTRLLGLWGSQMQFQLPERLPDLPKEPADLPGVERTAIAQRLDVQAAKLATEQTAENLGLTQTTRFINVLEVGVVRNSSNIEPTQRGWELSLELPLFDWGTARVARAEGVYMQSVQHARAAAINARSEVREAYGSYRAAWDIARHSRDEVVPLRRQIADENLLRYNGMLIGVFELLADARAQIASVNGYIDSLRDFWLAQADLDMAMIGKPSLAAASSPAMAAPAESAGH